MSDAPTILLSRVGVAGSGDGRTVTVEVPKSIGPVRLIRQLGSGAMGVVWLGHHEVLARDVAVKFLLAPGTATEGPEFDLFIQGARAAAAVRHPGITAVHDAGAVGGVPYIVMEYVEGPTLSDVMRHGVLSPGAVRTIMREVCAAVGELHEQHLVHRDLKPSNIMVGADGTVLVTDFGLACPVPESGSEAKAHGAVSGTPAYMAPELYHGEISAKSDIYALGATAYELLLGRPALQGDLRAVRTAAEVGVEVRVSLTGGGAPEGVIDAIERAMNKEALFRPKTAARLSELLEQGFESARIATLEREQVQAVAFPGAARAAPAVRAASSAPAGATTFDLVSEKAAEKRRAASVVVAPERSKPLAIPRPRIFATAPVAWGGALIVTLGGAAASIVLKFLLELAEQRADASDGFVNWAIEAGGFGLRACLVFVGMVLAYLWVLKRRGPLGRCEPICGWCGHSLKGVRDQRCTECGRSTSDRGAPGERPPARRWKPRVLRWGVGLAAYMALCTMLWVPTYAVTHWMSEPGANGILDLFLEGLSCVLAGVPALALFHWAARRWVLQTGEARCGRCGTPSKDLEGGHCAVCEERERATGDSGGGPAGRAPSRRSSVPWVRLLACAALGTALMSAVTITLQEPPWGRVAFWIADLLHAWDPTTAPQESYGHWYPGLPGRGAHFLAHILVGPPMFAVLGALLMALYHWLAFGRRRDAAGEAGVKCGWCGYRMESDQCPECGHGLRDRGRRGDRPPAQRWSVRLTSYLIAGAAFVAAIFVSIYVVRIVMFSIPGLSSLIKSTNDQLFVPLVGFPTFVAALLAYHFVARRTAWLDGIARCGRCGAEASVPGSCAGCAPRPLGPAREDFKPGPGRA
jgi:serine/threonine-protein kinase